MEKNRVSLRETTIAVVVTSLALLPFIGKAFTMDDPMFLWAARQIVDNPLNPYDFLVDWEQRPFPMSQVNKNPPLNSYFLALAGLILGRSEVALHLSFLFPAATAVVGTYRLARRLSPRPLLAAIATLATPVFLVSCTNVMCETLLLACWVWAILLWIEGLDQNRAGRLYMSAFLISAASLVKYFGICLIPLLAVYAIHRKVNPTLWLPPMLVPLIALAGYQEWTRQLYGRGLLLDAAGYATGYAATLRKGGYAPLIRFLSGLVFTGGCVLPPLLLTPFLWSRKTILSIAAAAMAVTLVYLLGWNSGPLAEHTARWSILVWVQAGVFAAGGICVLTLAAADLRTRRGPDALLLALWVIGTFLFAAVVNWDVNGRAIMPMAPAAAILLARRMGPPAENAQRPDWKAWGPVALSGAVALLVAWGDASFADSQRKGAFTIRRMADAQGVANLWYEGHWGFQYYMDAVGGHPLCIDGSPLKAGDWVIIPMNNTNLFDFPKQMLAGTQVVSLDTSAFVATMGRAEGAGFYASIMGPLPFSFGQVSPDLFIVHRIGRTAGG